jgi:hypothetical protein
MRKSVMIFIRLGLEHPSDSIGIPVLKYLATDTKVGVCHQRMRGLRLLAAICISADASLRLAKHSNFGRSISIRKLLYDNAKLFIVFRLFTYCNANLSLLYLVLAIWPLCLY